MKCVGLAPIASAVTSFHAENTAMPDTLTTHQRRWNEIVQDPALRDLPYKVETNARSQIILSSHKSRHSYLQKSVMKELDRLLPDGESFPEYPVETSDGIKQPDVVWMTSERRADVDATGDPPTLAPNVCVEVMSSSNSESEMQTKRRLYRDAGASEVWIVEDDGTVRFFADDALEASRLAPDFPSRIEV